MGLLVYALCIIANTWVYWCTPSVSLLTHGVTRVRPVSLLTHGVTRVRPVSLLTHENKTASRLSVNMQRLVLLYPGRRVANTQHKHFMCLCVSIYRSFIGHLHTHYTRTTTAKPQSILSLLYNHPSSYTNILFRRTGSCLVKSPSSFWISTQICRGIARLQLGIVCVLCSTAKTEGSLMEVTLFVLELCRADNDCG